MRDGSWTGAILGRLNLVVRTSQMVKLVLSFNETPSAAAHDDTASIHGTRQPL